MGLTLLPSAASAPFAQLRPSSLRSVRQRRSVDQGNPTRTLPPPCRFQVLNERLDVVFHYFSNATPALQGE